MKFILFVEGHTEDKSLPLFFRKWLDHKLTDRIGIKTVRFEGWPELIKDAPKKARMHLDGPDNEQIIAVISLLDLYGPTIYPSNVITSEERYTWAKSKIENDVGLPKFFQFFAVHDVETWLLSEPNIFPLAVKEAFNNKIDYPEKVNYDEPPSKLLKRLYPLYVRRSYKKVVNGKELFGKLNPDVAYRKCPRLKELLDKMLELAEDSLRKKHG